MRAAKMRLPGRLLSDDYGEPATPDISYGDTRSRLGVVPAYALPHCANYRTLAAAHSAETHRARRLSFLTRHQSRLPIRSRL